MKTFKDAMLALLFTIGIPTLLVVLASIVK